MRIVAISDTHTQHRKLKVPDGDVLLFAGDGEFRTARDLMDFNNWLSELEHDYIFVIAGNHDFFCERYPAQVNDHLMEAVYLKDSSFELDNGMTIWGSPMTKTFLDWAFMESEENLDRHYWSKIPKKTDILLTHGPAFGHLDVAHPNQKMNLGSETLARRIEELKIPYVFCGHIHGGYGIKQTKGTTYINCSVLDEDYQLVNEPVVIDI